MKNDVVVRGGGIVCALLVAGLLTAFPGTSHAQVSSASSPPVPARQIPTLQSPPRQAPPDLLGADWRLSGEKPLSSAGLPGSGFERAGASGPATTTSVTLWTGAQDVEIFESGGNAYAVASFVPGIKIYDLSGGGDPAAIQEVSLPDGAFRMALEFPRLYVVDYFENSIHIFDLSNPASPSEIGRYYPSTGIRILNLDVESDILYLARNADDLWIVDVSNPASPVELAVYQTTTMTDVNVHNVVVSGGYAFLTTFNNGLMEVVDATTPSAPVWAGNALYGDRSIDDVAYLPAGTFHTTDVVAVSGVMDSSGDIVVIFFSWTAPNTLTWRGDIELTPGVSLSGLWDLELFENQAYVATGEVGVAAIDITGISTGISPTFVGDTDWHFEVGAVAVDGLTRTLLQTGEWDGLSSHTLLDNANPLSELGRVDNSGQIRRCQIAGNLLFVANGHQGIKVLDISSPDAPFVINDYPMTGWVNDIELDLPFIFVGEGENGVTSLHYDTDSNTFTFLDNEPVTSGYVWDVELSTSGSGAYDYLYVAQGLDGTFTYSVADPANIFPTANQVFSGSGTAGAVTVDFNGGWEKLSVAFFEDGVDVFDLTNPAVPSYQYTIPPRISDCIGVESDWDGNLWVTDYMHDLTGWDISGASMALELGSWDGGSGQYRQMTRFETNVLMGGGWNGAGILNWSDPSTVFEETSLETPGYARQVDPALDFFFVADTYDLVGAQMPSDLLLEVTPSSGQILMVGDDLQLSASGWSGGVWWDAEDHPVDGRTVATIDATGKLTAQAAGRTRAYVYDDVGKWGVSGGILVMGGLTLIDHTRQDWVVSIDDSQTYLTIPAYTFEEPAEIEVFLLNPASDIPGPPTGYEAAAACDINGMLFWSVSEIVASDFAGQVTLRLRYDPGVLPGGFDENNLVIKRYDDSAMNWVDVAQSTPDPDNDVVYGLLDEFSTFAIMYSTVTLSAPVLSGPANGVMLNTSTVDFAWQNVTDATSYIIEVASDPGFGAGDIEGTRSVAATSTQFDLSVSGDGTYFWRVQATDGTVFSPWSGARTFVLDLTAPALTVSALPSNLTYNTAVAVNATADDENTLQWVRLYYRETGEASWDYDVMTHTGGTSWSGTVPGSVVGYNGFEYAVAARDEAGNEHWATSDGDVGSGDGGGVQIRFTSLPDPSNIPGDVWFMVSVPHHPDNTNIGDILTGVGSYDDTVWRFFRWNNGSYQEVSSANLAAGRAYWLYHRRTGVHFDIGAGQTVESWNNYSISLAPGWNDIGSPFLFDVDWGDILTASGLNSSQVAGLYTWNGSDWGLPGTGQAVPVWRGVSVYNRTSGNLDLLIPPNDANQAASTEARTTEEDFLGWKLQLVLSQEGSPAVDNQNYVGVRIGSEVDWDPGDYPDPPMSIDGTARLAVNRLDRASDPGTYATDYVPGVDGGQAWPLLVESIDGAHRANLLVTGLEDLPDGLEAVLVDPVAGLRIDLDGREPYRFYPARVTALASPGQMVRRELSLLVGTPTWLAGMTAGLERLPARVELHPNYPNPFNPSTTIRFALREAGRVQLEIRNVRGQLVNTIADRIFEAGTHTLSWNGTDASGRAVASGIYLVRLRTGDEIRTRKMTLVR